MCRAIDRPSGPRRATLCASLGLLLAACAVGPNYHRPAPPAVNHYVRGEDPRATVRAQGRAQHFLPGAEVAADWWRLFGSDRLQTLMQRALQANPGLAAATASLRASQDELRAGYGIFAPWFGVSAGASRQRNAPVAEGLNGLPSNLYNLFSLSGTVDYPLDLFGGERRLVEQLAAQVDLQRATAQATYLTLEANLVDAVIARAAYQAQADATAQLIDLQREQVRLAGVQVQAGTQPYSSELSLRSQLASNEASIPQLQQKADQAEDLLAALCGRTPAGFGEGAIALTELHLPGSLPISVPATLVEQRPDIRIAEASAHAASAGIGVATAAMLPGLSLHGSLAANGQSTSQLFAMQGRTWQLGAQLTQPIFQGGALWFHRRAAIDQYQQAEGLYRQAVLAAFQQVADTLQALDNDARALRAEDEALETAAEALHLVQTNYAAGLATYLDVLTADAQYHQAQLADIQAIAARLQDTVALYVALGGGWWHT